MELIVERSQWSQTSQRAFWHVNVSLMARDAMSSWPPTLHPLTHPPTRALLAPSGCRLHCKWCCLCRILQLEQSQGGHGTADLLTDMKKHDGDLREGRESRRTATDIREGRRKKTSFWTRVVIYSGRLLGASSEPLTDRFKRLVHVGPWSPLNYESNQARLNSEWAGESPHDTLGSHQ